VTSDFQRETARIYAEMYEEGIEPVRGSWMSLTIGAVCFLLLMAAVVLLFAALVGLPDSILDLFAID
jgi:hypothetical protein